MKYALLAVLLGVTSVVADAVQAPLIVRVNTEPFKKAIRARDQDIIRAC